MTKNQLFVIFHYGFTQICELEKKYVAKKCAYICVPQKLVCFQETNSDLLIKFVLSKDERIRNWLDVAITSIQPV